MHFRELFENGYDLMAISDSGMHVIQDSPYIQPDMRSCAGYIFNLIKLPSLNLKSLPLYTNYICRCRL